MVSKAKQLPERLKFERLALIRERHRKLILEMKRVVESAVGDESWEHDEGFELN